MKKQNRKLRLHRDTLVRLVPGTVTAGLATEAGDVSSCTYDCACPDGCSGDVRCIGVDAAQLA